MRAVSLGIVSFARSKWGKAVVFALVVFAMVFGLSLAPAGVKVAQAATVVSVETVKAAGTWCSVKPSRIFQKGWQRYPTDPNFVMTWNGRSLHLQAGSTVYTYFNGQWMGLNYHGYMNDEYGRYNQWGIPTWMPGKYPRTWNNVNNWRINFWSADGGCK